LNIAKAKKEAEIPPLFLLSIEMPVSTHWMGARELNPRVFYLISQIGGRQQTID
jgi:hypothetical protein